MADIVDLFENNLGKNTEDGKKFYKFMEGGRFGQMAGMMERNIVGPYFFGEEKSYVDFFLAQHWVRQLRHHFGPSRACLSALYHPTLRRAVFYLVSILPGC